MKVVNVEFHDLESMFLQTLAKYDRIKAEKSKYIKVCNKKDAARELNMSFNTLQSKIEKGIIKTNKDGKVLQSSIDEYFNRNK